MSLHAFSKPPVCAGRLQKRGRLARSVAVHADGSAQRLTNPIILPSGAESKPVSLREAMSFKGRAPELINARLAMLGTIGIIGKELVRGISAFGQFCQHPAPLVVATLVVVVSYATLAPILRGSNPTEAFGPLTPEAEKVNGRVAMLAVGVLLAVELTTGSAML